MGVGVDATDWGPSKEFRAELEGYMPFMEELVLS